MKPDLERAVLGLELGSTRIKAVLIDENHRPIASGDTPGRTGWKTASGPMTWRRLSKGFGPATGPWPTTWSGASASAPGGLPPWASQA